MKAFNFSLFDQNSKLYKLSDYLGKWVVVYFYPKDDTPGCTMEACGFRDVYDILLQKGVIVIGISPDNQKSHQNFKNKFGLPFYLLSDETHEISEKYGAWGQEKILGKSYMGIFRMTFIIDENSKITKIFPKVNPIQHGKEFLGLF